MPRLVLSQITIYPVKSARGISLPSSRVDSRGLQYDRRWMVVDEYGKFLSQRSLPRMALIEVGLREEELCLRMKEMGELVIPLAVASGEQKRVEVWEDSVDAVDIGEAAATWFSTALDRPCRLVGMPKQAERKVDLKYAEKQTLVSFADAFPFMLISEASLHDLNTRLDETVPMDRFRPNLVVTGCAAYEEDTWSHLTIGAVGFRVAKSCSRCTVPTVDQQTGIRGSEPIRTLTSYRTRNGKVDFGQNLVHKTLGVLSVGDEVLVTPA